MLSLDIEQFWKDEETAHASELSRLISILLGGQPS